MKLILIISYLLTTSASVFSQENTKNLKVSPFSLNGSYQLNDERINKKEFANILKNESDAFELYKKGNRKVITGTIISIPSLLLIASMDWRNLDKNPPHTLQWLGGFGGCVVSILLNINGYKDFQEAANIYNNNNLSLDFNLNNNGLGVVMLF